jgi:hypothetical protein
MFGFFLCVFFKEIIQMNIFGVFLCAFFLGVFNSR